MVRLERHGGSPDLESAFQAMILGPLGGRSLDDNHSDESAGGRFPDFGALRDLLLIEMKHLETDQNERMNTVLRDRIHPSEMPVFYGTRDANLILEKTSNKEEVLSALLSKLARSLENLLRSANRQFESYRIRHPRKNYVNLCVILNAKLREFTPEIVGRAIHSKMKGITDIHESRFPHIDGVLYISEKHFRLHPDGRPALGMVIFEGVSAVSNPWKADVIQRVAEAWSLFRTGSELHVQDELCSFNTVEDIPEKIERHEAWRLAYRRKPHLAGLSPSELRLHFHRIMAFNSLTFVKGNWIKPSHEETLEGLRQFQDIIEETNRRGIDMREFSPQSLTEEERNIVYAGFPDELVSILSRRGG